MRGTDVDWKAICQVLEGMEPERTHQGFLARSLDQLRAVVAFDHGFACMSHATALASGRYPVSPHAPCVYSVKDLSLSFWTAYCLGDKASDLLINRDPTRLLFTALPRVLPVDWARAAGSSDVRPLLARNGTRYAVTICNDVDTSGWGFRISLYRGNGTPFSERDCAMLRALYPHFHNLYQALTDPGGWSEVRVRRIACSAGLSKREVEVALLLSRRLSSSEIAERLFISRHTVEKHLEHIYGKLRAEGRSEARGLLTGDGPAPLAR